MERLHEAVVYINKNNIQGSLVECGVYKGGSVMNMALTQLQFRNLAHIYLYDTYEGMTPSDEFDVNWRGITAARILKNPSKKCICSLEEVKKNVNLTNYPKEFLHFRKGDVASTLTKDIPQKIALLRVDVDWYKPTKITLEALYPKLVEGGVLILDDYGYWKGSRKATDEYFKKIGITPDFEPIEEGVSGVYCIKKTKPIKLNLGSKHRKLPGFDNLDKLFGWYFQSGLPKYKDNSVDGITISHALMFLKVEELQKFAKEMWRVLKPAGVVRITEDDTENPKSAWYKTGNLKSGPSCLTGPKMMRHELEQANFKVFDVDRKTTNFKDDSLMQTYRGGPPNVFFIEGVKKS